MNSKEKNSYVKQQLTSTLLTLLQEKTLSEISVSELTKTAGVGRASFYRNFESLQDILYQYDHYLIAQWAEAFMVAPDSSIHNVFDSLFLHYQTHREFYLLLYKNGLTELILATIKDKFGLTAALPNEDAYSKAFWVYGVYGWLIEWMGRGMVEKPEDMRQVLTIQQSIVNII